MALIFDAPVTPDDLTVFVRGVPWNSNLRLSQLFGSRVHNDNRVNLAEVTRTNRTAKFRAFDGAINVTPRDAASVTTVPLPALSSAKPPIGEYERLQIEFARTAGTNVTALSDAIYDDAQILTEEIHNRWELAWGDLLTDGKLTTTAAGENGFVFEADYGVPTGVTVDSPGGSQIVSAGTAWTTIATADALADLIAWTDVYIANNGAAPANFLTSTRVLRLLQTNAKVINAIAGSAAGRTRVRLSELVDLLSSEGLPTPLPAYDATLSVDGTVTRVIADDKIVFLPADTATLGHNAVGISATALELVGDTRSSLTFSDSPGIVGVINKGDEPPYRQQAFVDAVGMPVLDNARRLMVADVA